MTAYPIRALENGTRFIDMPVTEKIGKSKRSRIFYYAQCPKCGTWRKVRKCRLFRQTQNCKTCTAQAAWRKWYQSDPFSAVDKIASDLAKRMSDGEHQVSEWLKTLCQHNGGTFSFQHIVQYTPRPLIADFAFSRSGSFNGDTVVIEVFTDWTHR